MIPRRYNSDKSKRLVALGPSLLPLIFILLMFTMIQEIIPAHFGLVVIYCYSYHIHKLENKDKHKGE